MFSKYSNMQAFFGQIQKTQFPIFKTQFRFFGQKLSYFWKTQLKLTKKPVFGGKNQLFWRKLSSKGQNSVFQKNPKREKRGKCPKIKPDMCNIPVGNQYTSALC